MATIQTPSRPDVEPSRVTFYSRDRGGELFSSFGFQGHLHVAGMPGWTFQDTYTNDLRKSLRLHMQNRIETIPDPITIDRPERAAEAQRFLDHYMRYLKDAGWTHQVSDNEYQFKILPAFRWALRIFLGELRARIHRRIGGSNEHTHVPSVSTDAAVDFYKRFEAQVRGSRPMHWAVKLLLLFLSVIGFCAFFGLVIFSSWLTVFLLALAVLFHELGHLVGMWIFGYRDLQILFIPAFGAITTGIKLEAEPWQRAIVTFLGPLPGLILGGAMLWKLDFPSPESWQFQLAAIMISVNYLNLLPMLPFDGGVIMEVAIADRFPYLTHILTCVSALAFATAGIFLKDVVLLVIAGVLFVLLRSHWSLPGAQKALWKQVAEGDDDEALRTVFIELTKPDYKRLSLAAKVRFAKKLLNQRKKGRAGPLLAITCLAVQITSLALPMLLVIWAFKE